MELSLSMMELTRVPPSGRPAEGESDGLRVGLTEDITEGKALG